MIKLITDFSEDYSKVTTVALMEDAVAGVTNGAKKKNWYINGVFLQADVKNRNKRIYPKEILFEKVNDYIVNYVNEKRAVGELGHPESITINPDRISHRIQQLKTSGNDIYGKAKIIGTMPFGKLTENLLEEGIKLGVSSRGMGSVDNDDSGEIVKEDFFLAAIDVVHDPSAPKAFVEGIMEGRKFLIRENKEIKEFDNEKYHKIVNAANRRNREKMFEQLFNEFVKQL